MVKINIFYQNAGIMQIRVSEGNLERALQIINTWKKVDHIFLTFN